ncbi:MAG: hypothetical protein AB7F22_18390 [Reyranella sp.]|uniref:hypothetical protein n=1 Tax=Reyranella sp. TaxID=1929291 RepID=UPI003D0AD8B0
MVAATDTLIARLQADCTDAEAREQAVRAAVEAELREAEQARAFAWRRLGALGDMARIAATEPDRELAVERQLAGLFRDIGWVENGLDELPESARPLLDRLRPIAEALHAQAHSVPADAAEEPATRADPLAAFRAFETWYEAERGQPFLQVFERYVPPTPLVEF